jgi:hypothetical protein
VYRTEGAGFKLMVSPCGSASNALRNLWLVVSREKTSSVTVRISVSPGIYVVPEIIQQDFLTTLILTLT